MVNERYQKFISDSVTSHKEKTNEKDKRDRKDETVMVDTQQKTGEKVLLQSPILMRRSRKSAVGNYNLQKVYYSSNYYSLCARRWRG